MSQNPMENETSFACASYIKTIGRGARGARGLDRNAAYTLYSAILAGRVSPLELGAVLLAYRVKGESAQELAGMLDAAHEHVLKLAAPGPAAVSLPSYNGARKLPNLVPLLAVSLAQKGIAVLVHGVRHAPSRVSTMQVFEAMGMAACESPAHAQARLDAGQAAFLPIDVLSPSLAAQIALMGPLGVRNSAHTLAKLINPFTTPALRCVNITHEAYFDTLTDYFVQVGHAPGPGVLLGRGTEGEAVADTTLARSATWMHDGLIEQVIEDGPGPRQASPAGDDVSAAATARYIRGVLAGDHPMPDAIARQIAVIERITRQPA